MTLTAALKKGSQDPCVATAQQQLIALGYGLPRFGADGTLGDETLSAYGAFLVSQGLRAPTDEPPRSITPTGAEALEKVFLALSRPGPTVNIIDERSKHPHKGRSVSRPYRKWSEVTAVVLHQTASNLGEKPTSWYGVPIHFGVTRAGPRSATTPTGSTAAAWASRSMGGTRASKAAPKRCGNPKGRRPRASP
jgi:peptidoglycan hydrolase-like protein with peptidoglycan-binding domain